MQSREDDDDKVDMGTNRRRTDKIETIVKMFQPAGSKSSLLQ